MDNICLLFCLREFQINKQMSSNHVMKNAILFIYYFVVLFILQQVNVKNKLIIVEKDNFNDFYSTKTELLTLVINQLKAF